jgi:hypothetical protein
MTSIDILSTPRVHLPKPYTHIGRSHPILIHSKSLNFTRKTPIYSRLLLPNSFTVLCKSNSESSSQASGASETTKDDFVTRVLKENPSQVESKYRIGNKLYTLKEKEDLGKNPDVGVIEFLAKRLNLMPKAERENGEGRNKSGVGDEAVHLKDILREYRGKLYVPEQIFGPALSEEEEFDRNLEVLPRMSFEDFLKAMRSDKVKLLTSKEGTGMSYVNGHRDFIVELKEIPGDKSLHRTKW